MASKQDQYEKLEAYLDGMLDPQGLLEVQAELASNPQLRKVMADLGSTRDWVRALPHATAPADLIETFQGQLERSALLGETDEHDEVAGRIDPASHWMSIAAILLMAIGLGLIIYKMMPNRRHAEIAMSSAAPSAPTEGSAGIPPGKMAGVPTGDSFSAPVAEISPATVAPGMRSTTAGGGFGGGGGVSGLGGGDPNDASKLSSEQRGRKSEEFAAKRGAVALNAKPDSGALPEMPSSANAPLASTRLDDVNRNSAADRPAERPQVSGNELRDAQSRMARNEGMKTANSVAAHDAAHDQESLPVPPVVLLVKAQDARQANKDITTFLADNNIDFAAEVASTGTNTDSQYGALHGAIQNNDSAPAPATSPAKPEGGYANNQFANQAALSNTTTQASNGGFGNYGQSPNGPNTLNNTVNNGTQAPAGNNERSGGQFQNQAQAQNVYRNKAAAAQTFNFPATATDGVAAYRYHVQLTRQQQAAFDEYLSRRGDQWTEPQDEHRAVAGVARAAGNEKSNRSFVPNSADKKIDKDAPNPAAGGAIAKVGMADELEKMNDRALPNQPRQVEQKAKAIEAIDEPHPVVIIVPEKSIVLPTTLPSLTTQPAQQR